MSWFRPDPKQPNEKAQEKLVVEQKTSIAERLRLVQAQIDVIRRDAEIMERGSNR